MKKKENSTFRHFGLIGKDIDYSFSPQYFQDKFKEGNIQAGYKLYNLQSIEEFPFLFAKKIFSGLNVTIPYKEEILIFMDSLSPEAKAIGAVNTIQFKGQSLIGHNTDYIGFRESIKPCLQSHHTKALILGTGGATKAVKYALDELSIEYWSVSRNEDSADFTYAQLTNDIIKDYSIIINATPVGTFPNEDEMLNIPLNGIGSQHLVYDLIYNPSKTKLLVEAEKRGATIKNGLEMLEIQAEEAWKIWNL